MFSETIVDEAVEKIERDFRTRVKDPLGKAIVDQSQYKFKKGDHWTYDDAMSHANHLANSVRTFSDATFNGQYKAAINAYVLSLARIGGTDKEAYPQSSS